MNLFKFYIAGFVFISFQINAQTKTNKSNSEYTFTIVKSLEATPVQNQNQSSTCWSFSTLSFFESEMARMGKGKDFNLSEMFVVRKTYPLKAQNYIRMHGKNNMAEGGGFPDVLNIMKKYGMMPEDIYTGKKNVNEPHSHGQLEKSLQGVLAAAADESTQKIDYDFMIANVESICDNFLGKVPEKFDYKGKSYTPKTYAEATGIVPEDYVYITSFSHHPFYEKFILEVPDNWAWEKINNVPLNELQEIMSYAIDNGYTFAWGADVSEKGFLFKDGVAVVPETPFDQMSDFERAALGLKPHKQLTITQEMRQKAFDNYETQDDHGMHAIGTAKDQKGTLYYIIKNSWGTKRNDCDGYFYASESYMLYKTTSIFLHKKAIPPAIAKKLGISQ
ncbi:MAG TPA: C1 family peptidase [Cytophaga sp.]|jgi:bleomycin hydrolase|nr:C1 family peptidase [Cytophaga sp.]